MNDVRDTDKFKEWIKELSLCPNVTVDLIRRYKGYGVKFIVSLHTNDIYKYKDTTEAILTEDKIARIAKNTVRRAEKLYAKVMVSYLVEQQDKEIREKRATKLKEIFPDAVSGSDVQIELKKNIGGVGPRVVQVYANYESSKHTTPTDYLLTNYGYISKDKLDKILTILEEN